MFLFTPFYLLLVCSWVAQSLPLYKRDADFLSVRTRLSRDYSGKGGDPKDKYFHESTFHPHYDGRFADHTLTNEDRRKHLIILMQTYLSTMSDIGAETWIMHGTLLGWWWNRKVMPWDSDVDVQMSESSMEYLASYYNMTVHHYRLPGVEHGRDFLLEINPHYKNPSTDDRLNVIDARWIDTETGLFIDITTLRRNRTAEVEGLEGHMYCKDKHKYLAAQIFPLRPSIFEGAPVKIPYAYAALLEEEYGPQSLTLKTFEGHYFDETRMEWLPTGSVPLRVSS
ncbi:hypothetical protein EJ06DRAFT_206671 [Trichodelitschia bisporula]|uniref:LicD/FKTN/FKRP nucleotidyltransferase domain-containing protein n=1 Tax=Trichodelitschia bisporula TaxID=703511 RepID=A0A6G1I858_9PEZI|nr:hypothetical protein EJ06DRAFT_206671 [Trichodelitschia bisporula]